MEVFRRGMAGSFVAAGLVAVTALGAASVSAGPISTTADNPGNVLMSDSWDACGVPAGSGVSGGVVATVCGEVDHQDGTSERIGVMTVRVTNASGSNVIDVLVSLFSGPPFDEFSFGTSADVGPLAAGASADVELSSCSPASTHCARHGTNPTAGSSMSRRPAPCRSAARPHQPPSSGERRRP